MPKPLLLILGASAALTLAACGENNPETPRTSGTGTPPAASAPTNPPTGSTAPGGTAADRTQNQGTAGGSSGASPSGTGSSGTTRP